MLTGGIDLTNWNDKTIGQLRQIRAELLSLEIPQEILDMLDPETQARLQKAFDAIRGGEITKSDKVVSEKNVKAAQKLLNAFQGIGAAITEMGDAMGNDVLSGVGQILSVAEDVAGILAENSTLMASITDESGKIVENMDDLTKSADWITMIVKLVLMVIKGIVNAGEEANARIEALRQAALDAKDIMYDNRLADGVDSIFGKNVSRQIMNAKQNIDELNDAMSQTIELMKVRGSGNLGELFTSTYEAIKKTTGGKADAIANTKLTAKTGWFSKYSFTLAEMASRLGMDLFDDYGNVNLALVDAIENTYKLTDVSSEWLETLKRNTESYLEQMDAVKSAMNDIFGDIAASAADNIIDRWIEAGDAALDYADILDDVAKSYAKMLIQSAIIGDVLNDDEVKRVMQMFMGGDYEGAMAAIAGDMEQIAGMEPVFQQILEAFDPYFNKEGSDGTLANGIKGITEDTASLLASYLNAVRADVSGLRMLAETGWKDVSSILVACDMMNTLPTLNDYMAQVAASNANIESHTYQILRNLEAVTTSSTGRRAIAVDVQ